MARLNWLIDQNNNAEFRVLDLGGQPEIWEHINRPLHITILNLPGVARVTHASHHKISYVEGDACNLSEYADGGFDLVFSNSVIEHVGETKNVESFAREARRVGVRVWIQTPSKYFPLEPHTGMPFWWYYPSSLKNYFIRGWSAKLPAWTEMVVGTTYIEKKQLTDLFPGCELLTERFLGIPKSYIAVIDKSS